MENNEQQEGKLEFNLERDIKLRGFLDSLREDQQAVFDELFPGGVLPDKLDNNMTLKYQMAAQGMAELLHMCSRGLLECSQMGQRHNAPAAIMRLVRASLWVCRSKEPVPDDAIKHSEKVQKACRKYTKKWVKFASDSLKMTEESMKELQKKERDRIAEALGVDPSKTHFIGGSQAQEILRQLFGL